MRVLRVLFAALFIVLMAVGVRAQTATPSTPGGGGSITGALNAVNETTETLSGAIERFGLGVVLTVGGFVLVILIVAIVLRPIISSNTESNRAIVALSTSLQTMQTNHTILVTNSNQALTDNTKAIREWVEQSKARQKTDETMITTLTSVYDTQLRLEILVKQYREESMQDVRDEMTEDNNLILERLDTIATLLKGLKLAAPEQGERVDQIIQEVEKTKGDTGKLTTVNPPAEPSNPTSGLLSRLDPKE